MSDSSVTRGPVVEGDWRRRSPTLVARASFLFNSEELSDVRFIFNKNEEREESTVFGHKLILAMGSPVFNKMFFGQYQEFTTTVENEVGMDHQMFTLEAFFTFIKFLYTDKINFKNLSTEVIVGVLHCADYYDVPYLKMDCGKQLEKIITKENVIQVLEAGDLFRMKDLTEKTLVLIDQNIKFVFESEEIQSAKMETLVLILKRDSLDVDECFVLDLALKWAGMECGRQNLRASEENKRKVLGKVLFEIRFGLLTSDRISELVHSNVLTREESLDVVLDVHTPGPGYVTTTGISDSKRRRLAPEVRFKSNPRIFGQKKKLMGIQEMEKKWKQNNNCQYLKAMSLAKNRADLLMRGFPSYMTEGELSANIWRGKELSVFDLEVYKLEETRGEFRVQFKYNFPQFCRPDLLNPVWYEFDNLRSIQISEWY